MPNQTVFSKHILLIKFLLLTFFTPHAISETDLVSQSEPTTAQQRYVVDDLYQFIHSGPGTNYRILGSVTAGSKISLISEEPNNGYLQIIDQKGRSAWIEEKYLSDQPGMKFKYQQASEQLVALTEQLRQAEFSLPTLQQQVTGLSEENEQLKQQLDALKQLQNQQAQQTAQTQLDEKKQLLQYGGLIGGLGIVIGIVITLLLSRRKRYDSWH